MILRSVLLMTGGMLMAFLSIGQYNATTSDLNKNWMVNKVLGFDGSVKAISKQYIGNNGNIVQGQVRHMSTVQVFAMQVLSDPFGRRVAQTLPAPINSSNFAYSS